ncbi:NRDE family protein [Flavobacterium sp. NRK F7]|uniref:NRDE family protein n=1 Tax=Flavobacterium sp. NRK F7 TaxID=2954930 RepID=UPI002090FE96|nr:NRDE family protein [Flavobacterium sp. NRK F7]MCO6163714.1 NRDE family protein [Flavobacterium sp. NRK F7]
MCTVTYVPLASGFCITSNRDEQTTRAKALPPQEYFINNKPLTFPKDQKAGGTWFAQSATATLVLLNGAAEKHIPKTHYRKSRGLIVLDLIATEKVISAWKTISLEGIEPFTIVLYELGNLYELQWDEMTKKTQVLDVHQPYIWSSSTLYSKEIRAERAHWFAQFSAHNKPLDAEKLLAFHQFTQSENTEFGLQINRNEVLKTVSITQVHTYGQNLEMNYIDLIHHETHTASLT